MINYQTISLPVPEWLEKYEGSYLPTSDLESRMDFIVNASRASFQIGNGGPFAAGIFEIENFRLVSLGTNLVVPLNSSILHAEVVAIIRAQAVLETYNLGDITGKKFELITSCEPCVMCLGAICWSGISHVVSGATDRDCRSIGFDEGPKPKNWVEELKARRIEVQTEVLREEASNVLMLYSKAGIIYNSSYSK